MEKFLTIERKVKNEEIYQKVVLFGECLQPHLAMTVSTVLCQCFKLRFKHMTANLFAEIIFTCLRLSKPGHEDLLIREVVGNIDQYYSRRTKRSAHMVKNTIESLFNGFNETDTHFKIDLNGFTSKFLKFLSTFIQEIVYAN